MSCFGGSGGRIRLGREWAVGLFTGTNERTPSGGRQGPSIDDRQGRPAELLSEGSVSSFPLLVIERGYTQGRSGQREGKGEEERWIPVPLPSHPWKFFCLAES